MATRVWIRRTSHSARYSALGTGVPWAKTRKGPLQGRDSRRGRDAGGQRHGVGGAYTRGEGAAGSGQGRDPRQGRVGPAQDHRRGAHMKAATL